MIEMNNNPKCKECDGITQKMGVLVTQTRKLQRYRCTKCGRSFTEEVEE